MGPSGTQSPSARKVLCRNGMAVSDSRLLCPSAPVRAWSHLYGMLNVRAGQLQCNQNRGLNPSTETERVRKRLERSKVYAFNDHMPRPPICFFTTHGYSCSPTSPVPTQMFAPAINGQPPGVKISWQSLPRPVRRSSNVQVCTP